MRIGKTFTFESAHQLPQNPIYGKCQYLHGHSYKLTVEIEGDVNGYGWVMNFSDLKSIVNKKVIEVLDHKFLNDIIKLPTAENILVWIRDQIRKPINDALKTEDYIHHRIELTLWETETSYAKLIS